MQQSKSPDYKTPLIQVRPVTDVDDDDHAYIRGAIENRGPCPGLNSLANHGFLPRNGKNITPAMVSHALVTNLHAPEYMGRALGGALKPLLRPDGTFDLTQLRGHNFFEHDASLTRLDYHESQESDNYSFQPHMFKNMLDDAQGGPLTMKSLARSYVRRDRESRSAGAPSLPFKLWISRLIETISPAYVARRAGTFPREFAITFFTEERYPDEIINDHTPLPKFLWLGLIFQLLFWINLMKIGLVR